LRLERGLRCTVYVLVIILFATGLLWWISDGAPGGGRFYLLAVHGFAAMAFLVAFGAVLAVHVREGWRQRLNRMSGIVLLLVTSLLIVTAAGLYYAGSDILRNLASVIHIGVGLGLPLAGAAHIVLGRRARRLADPLSSR
jgi:hypothetical protein